jgi:hypothetical protein
MAVQRLPSGFCFVERIRLVADVVLLGLVLSCDLLHVCSIRLQKVVISSASTCGWSMFVYDVQFLNLRLEPLKLVKFIDSSRGVFFDRAL